MMGAMHMARSLRTHPRLRWPLRIVFGVLLLIITVTALGALWQVSATALDRRTYPPPGQLVDVGGHRLHLRITGEPSDLPTVVLEAGVMSAGFQWAWVQHDLSAVTQVVSYDRAGLGWSEPRNGPFDPQAAAAELHLALERAGVPGPYVLVGHSMGGLLVQVFAAAYPEQVAGLVLVDPAHPDALMRLPAKVAAQQLAFRDTLRSLPVLSTIGGTRMLNMAAGLSADLPEAERNAAQALFATTQYAAAIAAEVDGWPILDAAVRDIAGFGDLPLVVLSADRFPPGETTPAGFFEATHAMHTELAARSTAGRHVVIPASDHYSLVIHPEGSAATSAAVREVLLQGR